MPRTLRVFAELGEVGNVGPMIMSCSLNGGYIGDYVGDYYMGTSIGDLC